MQNSNWYYSDGQQTFGPLSEDELTSQIVDGKIPENHYVTPEGSDDWQLVPDSAFAEYLAVSSEPERPSATPPPLPASSHPSRQTSQPKTDEKVTQKHSPILIGYAAVATVMIVMMFCVVMFRSPGPRETTREQVPPVDYEAQRKGAEFALQAQRAEFQRQQEEQKLALERQKAEQKRLQDEQRIAAENEARRIEADAKRRVAVARIETLESELGSVRRSIAETESDMTEDETNFDAYLMNHKTAVAAIAAGAKSADMFGGTKKLSQDEQLGAALLGLVGVGIGLSNMEEVKTVGDEMVQYKARQEQYKSALSKLRIKAATLEQQIADQQKLIDSLGTSAR